ncbi:MAG TPA: CBS domain-containing protein [bacterium]|nr:CBS domain-containing protein [bacterium]
MLVQDQMSSTPITITADLSVPDALSLMREKKVRRLPVLDAKGKLVGIVSDKDLLYASPSPTTSLSVWEINSLLSKLTVDKVMTRKLVTVTGDTPMEEAARIMADRKIGGLPVLQGTRLVGIITETDIFRALLELLGGRRKGLRATCAIPGVKGSLAKVVSAVSDAGGDMVGLGVSEVKAAGIMQWHVTLKVQDIQKAALTKALKPVVDSVIDIREF